VDFDKLNKETLKSAFRYETLKSLRHFAKRGDWAISFDLKDGRFMLFPSTRRTGSTLLFSIGGKVFQFAALPFGWTLSPFVLTKVMRPSVVRFFPFPQWRGSALGGNQSTNDYRECSGGGRKWRIQEM
jgi:hypothetical protein